MITIARCGCSAVASSGCQCSWESSDCYEITGSGTAENPFRAEPIFDPDPDNPMTCGVNGMSSNPGEGVTNPPRGFATRIVPQSIPNNVQTAVQFTAADRYDTDSMHDPVVSPGIFLANTAGVYHADIAVTFDTNGAGARTLEVYRVGSVLFANDAQKDPSAAADEEMDASGDVEIAVGQYFEAYVLQSSGGPLDLLVARCTWHYVGPMP